MTVHCTSTYLLLEVLWSFSPRYCCVYNTRLSVLYASSNSPEQLKNGNTIRLARARPTATQIQSIYRHANFINALYERFDNWKCLFRVLYLPKSYCTHYSIHKRQKYIFFREICRLISTWIQEWTRYKCKSNTFYLSFHHIDAFRRTYQATLVIRVAQLIASTRISIVMSEASDVRCYSGLLNSRNRSTKHINTFRDNVQKRRSMLLSSHDFTCGL